jgi:hypothetical protein
MIGMKCLRATTTFVVEERPGFTLTELASAMASAERRSGWGPLDEEDLQVIADDAARLARIAARYKPGTVLERRASRIQVRRAVPVLRKRGA